MTKNKQKGFTLIELLVVIAIIGVLSSVVLASLNTARQKSRDATRIATLKQIQLALELYYDENRAYPAVLDVASLVTPGYISTIPKDPLNSGVYVYSYAGLDTGCSSYHLSATLESGTHSALSSDAEALTGGDPAICTGSGANPSYLDPAYDVKP